MDNSHTSPPVQVFINKFRAFLAHIEVFDGIKSVHPARRKLRHGRVSDNFLTTPWTDLIYRVRMVILNPWILYRPEKCPRLATSMIPFMKHHKQDTARPVSINPR